MPQNGKSFHQRTLQMGSRCGLEREAASRTTTLAWQREKNEVAPGSSGKGGAKRPALPGWGEGQQEGRQDRKI